MRTLLLASLPPILAMSVAIGAKAAEKTLVILGTATPGGGFPVYGQAVSERINAIDTTLDVRPQNTAGSAENIPLLEAGTLDIGLVQGEAALEALNGIGRPRADLRVIFAMYATPGMFVVRADSPYHSIEDLKGRPVAFGAKGSGLVILANYLLDGLGYDRDRDFQAILLDRAGDGPSLVASGGAAAVWGGGAVGRRWRWAGLHGGCQGARRRPLHRARRRRHPADLAQTPLPQGLDGAGRVIPGPNRADPLGRLLELHPVATDAARRCGLS